MTDAERIERAATGELNQVIARDKTIGRIRDPERFRWLTLNNLRIALSRLPATELAEIAGWSGSEILARFPGPTFNHHHQSTKGGTPWVST